MNILTVENQTYDLEYVPDQIDDIRYCVLDYSDKKNPDYFFMPLVFLEVFNSPAAVVSVGGRIIKLPIDNPTGWHIVVCDQEDGNPEVVPITAVNNRGFTAICYNPLRGFRAHYRELKIENVYPDVKWYMPKIKNGHFLCVPIEPGENPECVLIVKEANKVPEVLDISEVLV